MQFVRTDNETINVFCLANINKTKAPFNSTGIEDNAANKNENNGDDNNNLYWNFFCLRMRNRNEQKTKK